MDDIWNDMLIGFGGLFAVWLTVRLLGSALRIAQNWFDDRRDANCGSSLLAETNEALKEAGLNLKSHVRARHMTEVLIEDIG